MFRETINTKHFFERYINDIRASLKWYYHKDGILVNLSYNWKSIISRLLNKYAKTSFDATLDEGLVIAKDVDV